MVVGVSDTGNDEEGKCQVVCCFVVDVAVMDEGIYKTTSTAGRRVK